MNRRAGAPCPRHRIRPCQRAAGRRGRATWRSGRCRGPPNRPWRRSSIVAVSQVPSSEIEVRVRPSAVTCRSDQPPNMRELALIEMPPRHSRRPTRVAPGSSSLRCRARLWISSACGCAPAGGKDAPVQAAASRQRMKKARTMTGKVRPSSRRLSRPPWEAALRRRAGPIFCRRTWRRPGHGCWSPASSLPPRRTARRAAPSSCRRAGRRRQW